MIEVKDNERLDISIENSNYEFDKVRFFKNAGLIAAGSFALTTGLLCGVVPDSMPLIDAATYGLYTMGGLTATYGIVGGFKAKKAISSSKKANANIKSLSETAQELGLENSRRMERALKDSEIVTIGDIKKVDDEIVAIKHTKYVFASPETSIVDEHKCTHIFRQETNSYYNNGTLDNVDVGNIGIVELEDFDNPEYADDLKLAVDRMTGNLTRKKTR